MRALVTGAAGFIGSHLVERLLADGAHVVGIDCFTDYYARELKETNLAVARRHDRFTFVESRLQDADLDHLLRDATHVFHLAAQAGVRKSWGLDFAVYTACNVEATQVLLEACTHTELSKLVYASSSSVYGDDTEIPMGERHRPQPVSPYGVSKLAAEHLCYLYWVAHRVPTVSLRYFTVYGPRQRPDMAFNRFLRAMLAGNPVTLYGDGEQTRDYTFVRDAVSAAIAAADRGEPGNVYNIGGGARVSVNRVLEVMAACTGTRPRIERHPAQKGDMRDTHADTTAARRALGFAPHDGARSRNRGRVPVDLQRGDRRMTSTGILRESARPRVPGWWRVGLTSCLLAATALACGGRDPEIQTGQLEADRLLFERGTAALEEGDWQRAREYFVQIRDNYPQSQYRAEARLSIGDTYEGEGTADAYVQALDEYQDFLSLYPTSPARRVRPVQGRHGALPPDAAARARSDGNDERGPRVRDLRHPLPPRARTDGAGPTTAARRS